MEKDLQKNWNDTKFRRPDSQQLTEIMQNRRITAISRLMRRYHRFSNVALVMILWCLVVFFTPIFPQEYRLSLALSFGIYFLTVSIMDYWLYNGLKSIDCAEMSVREVAYKATFYRKRHLQFVAILLPLAIALVTFMIWVSTNDPAMIAGTIVGTLLGLAVGTRELLKFMNDYRDLTRDLTSLK